jgi:hypothetical protein
VYGRVSLLVTLSRRRGVEVTSTGIAIKSAENDEQHVSYKTQHDEIIVDMQIK